MAIAGPGSDSGTTYTVYDPEIGENVVVGEEQVTGNGYYANLYEDLGEGGTDQPLGEGNGGWISAAISGGASVISSALNVFGGGNGNGNGETQPPPEEIEQQSGMFGFSNQQLLLMLGGGALVWYVSQD